MNGKKVKQLKRLIAEATEDELVPRVTGQGYRRLKAEYTRRPRMTVDGVKTFITDLVEQDLKKRFLQMRPEDRKNLVEQVMRNAAQNKPVDTGRTR